MEVNSLDWKQQQKIKEDISQCVLNPDLSITKNTSRLAEKQSNVKFDTVCLCPFCLMSYELDKFILRKGLRVCPNCCSQLKLTTLSEINDLNKFVDFVFGYRFNGFWNKICLDIPAKTTETRFNEWNIRLHSLGLSYAFWERYKALKGDNDETQEDF
jgi:hypothetical protein